MSEYCPKNLRYLLVPLLDYFVLYIFIFYLYLVNLESIQNSFSLNQHFLIFHYGGHLELAVNSKQAISWCGPKAKLQTHCLSQDSTKFHASTPFCRKVDQNLPTNRLNAHFCVSQSKPAGIQCQTGFIGSNASTVNKAAKASY